MLVPNKIEKRSEGEEEKEKRKGKRKEKKKTSILSSDSLPSAVRCCAVLSMRPQPPTQTIRQDETMPMFSPKRVLPWAEHPFFFLSFFPPSSFWAPLLVVLARPEA